MDIIYIFLFMSSFTEISCAVINLTITGGSVNNYELRCAVNKRIQLKDYRYMPKRSGHNEIWEEIDNPVLLFSACSWSQNCTLTDALVANITDGTKAGNLYLKYSCTVESKKRSFCSTLEHNDKTTNLITVGQSQYGLNARTPSRYNTCSCISTGTFKLRAKDIRLQPADTNVCPWISIHTCFNNNCTSVHLNCTNGFKFNLMMMQIATYSNISLSGLSSLYFPSTVWIQIIPIDGEWYNIICVGTALTSTTTTTITTTQGTILSTDASSVPVNEPISSSQISHSDEHNSSSWFSVKSTSTSFNKATDSNIQHSLEGKSDEDPVPVAGIAVPVIVVGLVGAGVIVVIIIYHRRRRSGPKEESNAIANPAYTNTSEENDTIPVISALKSRSYENGLPDVTSGCCSDFQDDYQYNVIENNIDDEYNKIQFKPKPVHFDDTYGHIKHTGQIEDKEYDHVTGIQGSDSQTYSHVKHRKPETNNDCNKNNNNEKHNADGKLVEDTPYDHLGILTKQPTEIVDDLDSDYSHLSSSKRGVTKMDHIFRVQNTITPAIVPSPTSGQTESSDSNYSFAHEPGVDNGVSNAATYGKDCTPQPYFTLERTTSSTKMNQVLHGQDNYTSDIASSTTDKLIENNDGDYSFAREPSVNNDGLSGDTFASDGTCTPHPYFTLEPNE